MAGEQPIRPGRSLAFGHDNHTLSPLPRTRYFSPGSLSKATSSATLATQVIWKGSSRSYLEVVGVTPGTGLSQGRKRTRAALKRASSLKTSAKKARAVTPPSAFIKAKSALNKHFTQRMLN
ncbi:hypothetical protein M9H77_36156 [Catharanthus roseus]|uniref:Uncharacterized protein n=1 Tax=Catharanthus roseus TaxID=4058 RepID=A0ACB9ZQZ7_CATRO|nr:hypothetical protein M9H77_36156 [Catharanthus roseus]